MKYLEGFASFKLIYRQRTGYTMDYLVLLIPTGVTGY